jgi:hypothetical protein
MEGRKLSEIIGSVFCETRETTNFGAIIDELDHHGMAIILILFSIPSALPIPAAGYSTILSAPLLLIGMSFLLGKDSVWLPDKVKQREFRPADFRKLKKWMLNISRFIEKFSQPRLAFITQTKTSKRFLGILICGLAAFMVLPIPGTNTLPAGGIFLIGFGLLEDDGLLVGAGILYSVAATLLALLIIFFGYEIVKSFILGLI